MPGQQANHKDGDPWNNVPENLEWVTRVENLRHAHSHGLLHPVRGEEQSQSKLTEEAVRYIRQRPETRKAMADRFGVSLSAIRQVLEGKKWKHVQ